MADSPKVCWPVTRFATVALYVVAGILFAWLAVSIAEWRADTALLYADRMRIAGFSILWAWVISGVVYVGITRWWHRG
jgi:hypothetical protein